jgi:carboxyl-terminal processing protease
MWLAVLLAAAGLAGAARADDDGPLPVDRDRARAMLRNMKKELESHYYDPTFHGFDLEARFQAAEDKIPSARSLGQLMGIVAQAVLDLEDSHTRFFPPPTTLRVDYGWRTQMIGDRCVVTFVKPGSDAEAQGIRRGDVVHEIDGVRPTRHNLSTMRYSYYVLRPRPGVTTVVEAPGQAPRTVRFKADVRQGKRVLDFTEGGEDFWDLIRRLEQAQPRHELRMAGTVAIWKMGAFDMERDEVDRMMGRVGKGSSLVLDLRGNGGGWVKTLEWLASTLFDRRLKIADVLGRKKNKTFVAQPRGEVFKGPLVVLVDSRSGSAAEVLGRVVQIEKRGTVIGDRTAGAVMQSRVHPLKVGLDRIVPYAISITNADVIMGDGQSLEKVGVTPDELLLPSPEDLAAGRDPVLARAIALADGPKLDPAAAGALFPREER